MVKLGLLVCGVLAARVAHADVMVASLDNRVLRVHRIGGDAVTPVFEQHHSFAYQWQFSNEHTLWVLRHAVHEGRSELSVYKVVNATAETPHVLIDADYKMPGMSTRGAYPALEIGTHGEAWIAQCFYKSLEYGAPCVKAYLRLDGKAFVAATKAPVRVRQSHAMPVLASAPTGYSAKLFDHQVKRARRRGVTCSGPNGKRFTWEKPADTPTKVEWISASPPIARITYVDPDGMPLESPGCVVDDHGPSTEIAFIEDCKRELSTVRALSDDVWISSEDDSAFTVWRDAKQLGTVAASRHLAVWP